MEALSRADLIRGRLSKAPVPIRPPWALPERRFRDACTRCNACRDACPEGIIGADKKGLPRVDFAAGECTFCGDCAAACEPRAVRRHDGRPWHIRARIEPRCLARRSIVCRSCEEACEPRAIRFRIVPGGVAEPSVAAADCTGCGACVSICPVDAVTVVEARP